MTSLVATMVKFLESVAGFCSSKKHCPHCHHQHMRILKFICNYNVMACFVFLLFVLFAIFILHSRESELYRYTLDGKSALAWELPFSRFMGHLSST